MQWQRVLFWVIALCGSFPELVWRELPETSGLPASMEARLPWWAGLEGNGRAPHQLVLGAGSVPELLLLWTTTSSSEGAGFQLLQKLSAFCDAANEFPGQ